MDDEAQARAYAEADFSEPHEAFAELLRTRFEGSPANARVVDLGCGPCDVVVRLAALFPDWRVDAVDGAPAMVKLGEARVREEGLAGRVRVLLGRFPDVDLEVAAYDVVVSNSLLHHLPDPAILWGAVTRLGAPGARVGVMDLHRPASPGDAQALLDLYGEGQPEVLRRDFLASLHAAYTPEEVRAQIDAAGLSGLEVEVVSDRHLLVHGRLAR